MQRFDIRRLGALPLARLDSRRLARDHIPPLLAGNTGAESEPAESRIADTLDGERLAHDGATAGNDLEVRHSSAANARGGARREGAEGARGGLLEERTQTAGLV